MIAQRVVPEDGHHGHVGLRCDARAHRDHGALAPRGGETVEVRKVRYRTIGDANLTAAVESDADTLAKIVEEVASVRITERGATRGDDRFSDTAMEDRKREGYF